LIIWYHRMGKLSKREREARKELLASTNSVITRGFLVAPRCRFTGVVTSRRLDMLLKDVSERNLRAGLVFQPMCSHLVCGSKTIENRPPNKIQSLGLDPESEGVWAVCVSTAKQFQLNNSASKPRKPRNHKLADPTQPLIGRHFDEFRLGMIEVKQARAQRPAHGYPSCCIEGVVFFDSVLTEEERNLPQHRPWVRPGSAALRRAGTIIFGNPIRNVTHNKLQGPHFWNLRLFHCAESKDIYEVIMQRLLGAHYDLSALAAKGPTSLASTQH
jgi:hypothetical protein